MSRSDSDSASRTAADLGSADSIPLDLLRIVADPDDRGPLTLIDDRPVPVLHNPRTGRVYPVIDGIPRLHQAASVDAQSR